MTGAGYAAVKGIVGFSGIIFQDTRDNPQACLASCDSFACSAAIFNANTRACTIFNGASNDNGQINNVDTTYIYVPQPAINIAALFRYQYSNPTGKSLMVFLEHERYWRETGFDIGDQALLCPVMPLEELASSTYFLHVLHVWYNLKNSLLLDVFLFEWRRTSRLTLNAQQAGFHRLAFTPTERKACGSTSPQELCRQESPPELSAF